MDISDITPPPVDRLVVGIDGSKESRAALRFAAVLGRALGVRVRVATSWEHPPTAIVPGGPPGLPTRAEGDAAAEALIEEVIGAELDEPARHRADPVVLRGRPSNALLHLALDRPGATVVVGTRGQDGFSGMVLGSTSRALLHDDRVPVVVVQAGNAEPDDIRTIVVGVDEAPGSLAAAAWAADVAARSGARVVAVHGTGAVHPGVPWPDEAVYTDRQRAELEGPWTAPLRERGVACRTVLSDEDPRPLILRTAAEERADLVVVGRSSGHGFARWAIGNVAESVVRHATSPVAVVSSER